MLESSGAVKSKFYAILSDELGKARQAAVSHQYFSFRATTVDSFKCHIQGIKSMIFKNPWPLHAKKHNSDHFFNSTFFIIYKKEVVSLTFQQVNQVIFRNVGAGKNCSEQSKRKYYKNHSIYCHYLRVTEFINKKLFSQFFLNTKCILWDVIFNVHIALKNKPFYMKIIIQICKYLQFVQNGVRKGAVSSPVLFCIYIDKVIKLLRCSTIGCQIQGVCLYRHLGICR